MKILVEGGRSVRDSQATGEMRVTAATYEHTIRKTASTLANVQCRPKLGDVLIALKNANVFTNASFGTTQSYLQFRNDTLHADWVKRR